MKGVIAKDKSWSLASFVDKKPNLRSVFKIKLSLLEGKDNSGYEELYSLRCSFNRRRYPLKIVLLLHKLN